MSEAERAREYQRQEKRREAYERTLAASLKGDPVALKALKDGWEALLDPPEKIL